MNSSCDTNLSVIEYGLDEYIRSIESGSIDPPCYKHLEFAIEQGADLDVVEYILQQGVCPNNRFNAMDLILSPDYEYEPNDLIDSLIALLFEYGAGYDSYMLEYLDEETREHFLDLERSFSIVVNIKG